ncbi:hypothetical protein HIM_02335 [Hirsutella minnesotensis 3608]|nr:hypothetical protein HIM_02335 [Hirsutella minnesotensis 3608]
MPLPERQTDGLEWVKTTFSLEPRWTTEIDIEVIKKVVEESQAASDVQVEFLSQGAFNKIYTVRLDQRTLIMRVSLPVDPKWKTASEVATMEWIRQHTALPVLSVVAHESSRDNDLGFEWILMSEVPGTTLSKAWTSIDMDAKRALVDELAQYAAASFKHQMRGIGNIFLKSRESSGEGDKSTTVGRIVSMQFFWGDRLRQNVARGPFASSRDWMAAQLDLNKLECQSTLASSQDEDEVEDAERTLAIVQRLQDVLARIFPNSSADTEPSVLFHDDLSRHNILVDEAGALTGVLDWECVSALLLWKACSYPEFLTGLERIEAPDPNRYVPEGDGDPGDLYWEHVMEHEQTLLRRHYLERMRALDPLWAEVFESSRMQKDFDLAVNQCDNEFAASRINAWIDEVAAGEGATISLYDRLHPS